MREVVWDSGYNSGVINDSRISCTPVSLSTTEDIPLLTWCHVGQVTLVHEKV